MAILLALTFFFAFSRHVVSFGVETDPDPSNNTPSEATESPESDLNAKIGVKYHPTPETDIKGYIRMVAREYNIDEERFLETAKCESQLNPNIQSNQYYPWGGREQSYGIWQLHLPSHPSITYEQAIDPEWATYWAAEQFAKGNQHWWTCYRLLYERF